MKQNTHAPHPDEIPAVAGAPERLALSKVQDADIQVRVKLDPRVVDDYAELMQDNVQFPPVVVYYDGTNYYLADGIHRVAAANKNSYKDIDADVRQGTRLDALWYALGANRTHGLRLGRGDVKKAIEIALKEWPEKSQAEIAAQIGTSQGYVSEIKATSDNIGTDNIPSARTDSLGRTRPTVYAKADNASTEDASIDAGHDDACDMPAPTAESATGPVGLEIASKAVEMLKTIPPNDTERMQAMQLVAGWLVDVAKQIAPGESAEGPVNA